MSGLFSSSEGQLGFLLEACRAVGAPLEVRRETQGLFPVATVILEFLSIFKRSEESSPFEKRKSACLSSCVKGCEAACRDEVENYVFL